MQVRDAVLYMLDGWLEVSSSATLFPAMAEAVANPKCLADGKVMGLQWCVLPGLGRGCVGAVVWGAVVHCCCGW